MIEITLASIVLVLGGVLTALQAGLMYDFNVDTVPALRSIGGKAHIAMMQAINVKIENPLFFLSFFGAVLVLPLAAFLYREEPQFGWLVAAAVLQIVGNFGVTVAGNNPLNRKFAKIDPEQLSDSEADQQRKEFQGPGARWMRLHTVRTLSSIAATTILFLVALSIK